MPSQFLEAFLDELTKIGIAAPGAKPFWTTGRKMKWGAAIGIPLTIGVGAHAAARGKTKGEEEARLEAQRRGGW